jgi:hypothetical protein
MPQKKNHIFEFSRFFKGPVKAFTTDASMDFSIFKSAPFLDAAQRDFLKREAQLLLLKVVNIRQVHGKGVLVATVSKYKNDDTIPQADAVITKDLDVPIAVRTADCIPIFIFDPKQKAIGIVHAGWRSSQKRIAEATLKKMKEKFKTRPQDVKVVFGPALQSCCYEVTEEFLGYFPKEIKKEKGKLYLDLGLANRRQLIGAGVASRNIFDCKTCTFCGKNYFSYRKHKEKAGRMLSFMMLKSHK